MTHYESLSIIPTKQQYDGVVEYKQKLEVWRIRRYGLTSNELDFIASVYAEVTSLEKPCSNCGGRLFPIVVLQWIHNFETSNSVSSETSETDNSVSSETVENKNKKLKKK